MPSLSTQEDVFVDVIVVGGGVSGAYAAWRLATETTRTVHLYERSDRIGGRLYTVVPPGMPHLRAELGAMRYNTQQKLVATLIDRLELKSVPFYGNDIRRAHLRGKQILDAGGRPTGEMPYNLRPWQQGKSAIDLLKSAITDVVPDAFELSPEELDKKLAEVRLGDKWLYEIGFWNLLMDQLGAEAYQYIFDSFGIESAFSNWNAARAIAFSVFMLKCAFTGPDVSFNTLEDGLSTLPLHLVSRFESAGGKKFLCHRLVSFKTCACGAGSGLELQFYDERTGQDHVVHTRALILAMPQRALELLDPSSLLFEDEAFRKDMNAVAPEQAFRLYFGYERPWWRDRKDGWSQGYSVTTLPIKQIFYWGTEGDRSGANPANQRSLLMAGYLDENSVAFWEPMEATPSFLGRLDKLTASPASTASFFEFPRMPNNAPRGMVETALRQISEVEGDESIPEPYVACYHDWRQDPYGGAWHLWKPGVDANQRIARMRHPVRGAPVYLCGEAYSSMQGWIEGALCSAELLLEEHFELKRPRWLPDDYYLGP